MHNQELKEQINQAIELINEAKHLIDDAVASDELKHVESRYKAYASFGFDTLLGNANPYDDSLNTLIQELEK